MNKFTVLKQMIKLYDGNCTRHKAFSFRTCKENIQKV